jgi:chromosome segregation ATPase
LLSALFRTLGFVRADQYAAAEEKLRKVQAQAAKAAETMDQTKAEAREWRARAGEAEKRVRDLEHEIAKQAERVEKTRADLSAQLDAERARVGELRQALRQRLADGDRDLLVARDHLMAIEVKLDILEGAANVLDGRTRAVLEAQQRHERGAAV